ncbi:hypothetical protein ACFLQ0_02675 [Nitrospinota bacterium]
MCEVGTDHAGQGFSQGFSKEAGVEAIRAEREYLGASILAEARWAGEDLWVVLTGGTRPHVGSVILTVPRPSLRDPSKISSTSSILNRPGHMDERPGRALAERLAEEFDCNVALACGIHYDNLAEDQVERIETLCTELGQELLAGLKGA